jgi:hypothetical protein
MVKIAFCAFSFLFLFSATNAQYFYKDIVSNHESANQWALYKVNNIKSIQIQSFFADNEKDEQFSVIQKNNDAFTFAQTETKTDKEKQNFTLVTYSSSNKMLVTIDSTDAGATKTIFTYDEKNRVKTISSSSTGVNESVSSEKHLWFYDADGTPTKMYLVKNLTDTTFIKFVADDGGNITDEVHERKGKIVNNYLYYYDAADNITDIVRFNERLKKLMPDYMFEYNEKGQLKKMVQLEASKAEYHTFQFAYNPKGLKIEELIYFKNYNQMLGKLVYFYK